MRLLSGLFDTIVESVVEDRKKLNFFVAWVIGQVELKLLWMHTDNT